MPTYKDIFNLNLKYIEYLLAKTSLTQGYMHNINVTGSEIEQEVRRLLKNLLPQRYHVTHGYIISAANTDEEPVVSPQVDVVIVDTLVPHSIFIVDQSSGMEVVPVEAVVGIFEVKRTLNKVSLFGNAREPGAIKHLRNICTAVGIRKDNETEYLTGGIEIDLLSSIQRGYFSNPIVGIISIEHTKFVENMYEWIRDNKINIGMIDIIFSIKGYMSCIAEKLSDGHRASIETFRELKEGETVYFATHIHPPNSQIEIVAYGFGYIVGYISSTGGRMFNVGKYFFNKSLLKPS